VFEKAADHRLPACSHTHRCRPVARWRPGHREQLVSCVSVPDVILYNHPAQAVGRHSVARSRPHPALMLRLAATRGMVPPWVFMQQLLLLAWPCRCRCLQRHQEPHDAVA
jgi:hypothetical protein